MIRSCRLCSQFTLRSLFGVVTIVALGCWWVNLPALGARQFVTACQSENSPDSQFSSVDSTEWETKSFRRMLRRDPKQVRITFVARTATDVIVGRQKCIVTGDRGRYRFTVLRGAVVKGPSAAFVYGGQSFILEVF